MRKITKVYLHCSASNWGDVDTIRAWHTDPVPRGRGWRDIGYHWVITGLFPFYVNWKAHHAVRGYDGAVWSGRPVSIPGAHVKGENQDSVGICLVGVESFSSNQITAAVRLCANVCYHTGLTASDVWGHYEFWESRGQPSQKSCPNIAMPPFRKSVEAQIRSLAGAPDPLLSGLLVPERSDDFADVVQAKLSLECSIQRPIASEGVEQHPDV